LILTVGMATAPIVPAHTNSSKQTTSEFYQLFAEHDQQIAIDTQLIYKEVTYILAAIHLLWEIFFTSQTTAANGIIVGSFLSFFDQILPFLCRIEKQAKNKNKHCD